MERDESWLSEGISRRRALRLMASGGAMALLIACGPAGAPPPAAPASPTQGTSPASAPASAPASTAAKTGGTLTRRACPTWAPKTWTSFWPSTNNNVLPLVYERLMLYNEKGELIPWLAESWKMSEDGRQWTFNLRKGVKWTNGDEFTSADVKFSFERYHLGRVEERLVANAPPDRRPDRDARRLHRAGARQGAAVRVLSRTRCRARTIINKKYFEKVGLDAFAKQPMGTGPWKLTKFTAGASAEFEANKDYWGAKPVWDNLVILQVPEESTRIAMLKRGEADIVGVSCDNAIKLRDEGYPAAPDQGDQRTVAVLCRLLDAARPDVRPARARGDGHRHQSPGARRLVLQRASPNRRRATSR